MQIVNKCHTQRNNGPGIRRKTQGKILACIQAGIYCAQLTENNYKIFLTMVGWHHSNAHRYYRGCEIQISRPHSKRCKTTVGQAFISRCDQLLRLLLYYRSRDAFFFFLYSTVQNSLMSHIYIYTHTQSVPGGMCQTSGGCSLC